MAESATALLKRDAALKSAQTTWLTRWQDIADYVAPERQRIITETTGPTESTVLYDSSAIHATKLLASSIHGTMTPSTQPWISFVMRDEELNDQAEVREWLEDCARRIHKALRQSNFSTSAHEKYMDLVIFGTACMLIEEKDPPKDGGFGGFRFTTVPIGTYRAAEDKDGLVDTLFRTVKMSRRNCVAMPGWKCGEDFESKAKEKPDEIVEVLHAVYPRRDRAYDAKGEPKGGSKNLPWASCYVLSEPKRVVSEGGYEEFPYVVPRWSKISGETYGSGPSHTAIYDIKTLNKFVEFMLQAIPLAMQPPSLERDDSVQGDIDRAPGGRIVVSGASPIQEMFAFLDTHYKPEVAENFRVVMKQEIERQYHADQLQLREGVEMTATEANIRYELMQRVIGPTTGRIETEDLNPGTWRMFSVMARRNALKPLPGALQEAVGTGSTAADLDVQYEGPLARAQRTIELTAQDRVIAKVAGISTTVAPFNPKLAQEVWDVLKTDKIIRDCAEIAGLPTDSLNSDEELQQIRGSRDQEQAQQQKMQQAQQMSEMAKNITPLVQGAQQPKPAATGKAA